MLVCRFGRWLHGCLVKSITDTLNQKVLYDPSGMLDRPGVAVSTVHGGVLLGAAAALSRKRHGRHPQFIAGSQPQAVIVCSIMASQGKDGPDATDPGSPREPRLCGCSRISRSDIASSSLLERQCPLSPPCGREPRGTYKRHKPLAPLASPTRSTAARTRPKMPPPSPSIRNRPSGRTTIPDRRPHYSINPLRCGGALRHLLQRCVLTFRTR